MFAIWMFGIQILNVFFHCFALSNLLSIGTSTKFNVGKLFFQTRYFGFEIPENEISKPCKDIWGGGSIRLKPDGPINKNWTAKYLIPDG